MTGKRTSAPEGVTERSGEATQNAQVIASAEQLDAEIKAIDLLIAELGAQVAEVTREQEALGNTVRSVKTIAATAPFRQHMAELEAERGRLSHVRTRYELTLQAYAAGRDLDALPPLAETVTDYLDLAERFREPEREVRADTLASRLEQSAAQVNARNEEREAAQEAARDDGEMAKRMNAGIDAEKLAAREKRQFDRDEVLKRFAPFGKPYDDTGDGGAR